MMAVQVGQVICWCAIPRQVLVHVQAALKVKCAQIHPIILLDKHEIAQYNELQSEGIIGRYLEK